MGNTVARNGMGISRQNIVSGKSLPQIFDALDSRSRNGLVSRENNPLNFKFIMERLEPVSYTHLDVYKRQPLVDLVPRYEALLDPAGDRSEALSLFDTGGGHVGARCVYLTFFSWKAARSVPEEPLAGDHVEGQVLPFQPLGTMKEDHLLPAGFREGLDLSLIHIFLRASSSKPHPMAAADLGTRLVAVIPGTVLTSRT